MGCVVVLALFKPSAETVAPRQGSPVAFTVYVRNNREEPKGTNTYGDRWQRKVYPR